MDKKAVLEKVAIAFGIAVIVGFIWFYSVQLGDTMEILNMAYPDD